MVVAFIWQQCNDGNEELVHIKRRS